MGGNEECQMFLGSYRALTMKSKLPLNPLFRVCIFRLYTFFRLTYPYPLGTTSSILCIFVSYKCFNDFINETFKTSVIIQTEIEVWSREH